MTVVMWIALTLAQKLIGPTEWGVFGTATAILTSIFMLSEYLALQSMVNFGVIPERRREALTVAATVHLLFCAVANAAVFLAREPIAQMYHEPKLATALSYMPLVSIGFLVRSFMLKVAMIDIDVRTTFFIEMGWTVSTVVLVVYGRFSGTLVDANDMMVVYAIGSAGSAAVGTLMLHKVVRFTRAIDRANTIQMLRIGVAQFGSAITTVLQTQGDMLVLKWFASSAVVGNYDIAKKAFRGFEAMRDAAALLIYPAVARLSAEGRRGELVALLEKMVGFMIVFIVPIVIAIELGPTDALFDMIFKGKFTEVAGIFRVMCLAALAIPFSMNMYVLGAMSEARRYFRVTLTAAVVSVVSLLVLVPPFGARGAALSVVASYTMLGILSTITVRRRVPYSITGALNRWRDITRYAGRLWRRLLKR